MSTKTNTPPTKEETATQVKTVLDLLEAFYLTIKEACAKGAPGDPMYLAYMQVGGSLDGFLNIMNGLLKSRPVVKVGDLYYPIEHAPSNVKYQTELTTDDWN